MILDPLRPAYYSRVNQLLISTAVHAAQTLRERWQDEAADAAVDKNPARAGYLEHMVSRL